MQSCSRVVISCYNAAYEGVSADFAAAGLNPLANRAPYVLLRGIAPQQRQQPPFVVARATGIRQRGGAEDSGPLSLFGHLHMLHAFMQFDEDLDGAYSVSEFNEFQRAVGAPQTMASQSSMVAALSKVLPGESLRAPFRRCPPLTSRS